MKIYKIFIIVAILVVSFFVVNPVSATTIDELIAQIAALQAQLRAMQQAQQGTATTPTTSWCHNFNSNIGMGHDGNEFKALITALDKENIIDGSSAPKKYDEIVAGAVVKFQLKYGITPISGYVGAKTRTQLNSIYGCTRTPPTTDSARDTDITSAFPGGLNYWTKGTASGKNNWDGSTATYADYCTNNVLTEYWNLNGLVAASNFSCPTSCSAGQCTGTPTITSCSIDGACTNSSEPSITVVSPNGGEQIKQGQNLDIVWNSTNLLATDKINIWIEDSADPTELNSGMVVVNLAGNLGDYDYAVPANMTLGSKYKIRIEATRNSVALTSDTSDNYFSIVTSMPASCASLWDIVSGVTYGKSVGDVGYDARGDVNGSGSVNLEDFSLFKANQTNVSWCNQKLNSTSTPPCLSGAGPLAPGQTRCLERPSITVTSPNGGEVWKIGETHNITWTSSGLPSDATVTLYLLNSNSAEGSPIMTVLASRGTYLWTVPAIAGSENLISNQFKISINSGTAASDTSNSYFSIAATGTGCTLGEIEDCNAGLGAGIQTCNAQGQWSDCVVTTRPTINVTSPNGGETWKFGENHEITWTSTGVDNVHIIIENDSNGKTCMLTPTGGTAASGGVWNYYPIAATSDCTENVLLGNKIKVFVRSTATSSLPSDMSNNYFSITKPVVPSSCTSLLNVIQATSGKSSGQTGFDIRGDLDSNGTVDLQDINLYGANQYNGIWCTQKLSVRPTITVLSPNGGETFKNGDKMTIAWSSTGLADKVYISRTTYDASNRVASTESIASGAPSSSGVYAWTIPSTFAKDHPNASRMKITVSSTAVKTQGVYDESDSYFAIVTPPASCVTLWNIVQGAFGKNTGEAGFDARADLNKDGEVGLSDMGIYKDNQDNGTWCSQKLVVCTPIWSCASWSTCVGGTQTRSCTDTNRCGILTNKPAESQSCTIAPIPGANNCRYDLADGTNVGNIYKATAELCKAAWDSYSASRPGSKVYFNGTLYYTYSTSGASLLDSLRNVFMQIRSGLNR